MKQKKVLTLAVIAMLSMYGTATQFAKNSGEQSQVTQQVMPMPVDPTERDVEEDYLARKNYLESLHGSIKGVNYDSINETIREANRKSVDDALERETSGMMRMAAFSTESAPVTVPGTNISGTWIERGSNTVSGRMKAVHYFPETDELYALSDGGTFWRGTGHGENWEPINDRQQMSGNSGFFVLPRTGGVRFVVNAKGNNGFYSDDTCKTWTKATGFEGTAQNWGGGHQYWRSGDNSLFVLSQQWDFGPAFTYKTCLLRSDDQGETYTEFFSELNPSGKYAIWSDSTLNGDAYFLKEDTLFHIATDNAMTQIALLPISRSKANIGTNHLYGTYSDGNLILTAAITIDGMSEVFQGSPATGAFEKRGETEGNAFGYRAFTVSPTNPNYMFMGQAGDGIRWSYDGGRTWDVDKNEQHRYDVDPTINVHADIPAIQYLQDRDGKWFQIVCCDGGMFRSDDDLVVNNNISLNGVRSAQYYAVATNPTLTDRFWAGAQDQGFQYSELGTGPRFNTIQSSRGDMDGMVSSDLSKTVWMSIASNNGFLGLLRDASSEHPKPHTQWVGWKLKGSPFMFPMMGNSRDPNAAYFAGGGYGEGENKLFYARWEDTQIAFDTVSGYDFGGEPFDLAYSPVDDNHYYLATNAALFHSADRGQNWTKRANPDSYNFDGRAILPSKLSAARVYVGRSGYAGVPFYVSENNGETFRTMSDGLPNTLIASLASNADESLIFAATPVGPYMLDVATEKWTFIGSDQAPEQNYTDVEFVDAINTARFATYGRGVWDFKMGSGFTVTTTVEGHTSTGGCDAPVWNPKQEWYDYTVGEEYSHNGKLYKVKDRAYAIYEPGTWDGGHGWIEIGDCVATSVEYFGSVTPKGTTTYSAGEKVTVTFAPDAGYGVESLMVNGKAATPVPQDSYTISAIDADYSIVVKFGTAPAATYEIEARAPNGGTISNEGINQYEGGKPATFFFTPDAGFEIAQLLVDGVDTPVEGLSYTFDNVQANHLIVVYFKPANRTLEFDMSYIGSIQWLSQNCALKGNDTYLLGQTTTISIADSIDEVHRFVKWEVVSGSAQIENPTAKSTKVTITDNVKILPVLKRVHTIEAIAGNVGGTVSNLGTNEYDEGSNATFAITPDKGYEIAEVKVDGVVTAVSGSAYTFANVQAAHQIVVYFKPAYRTLAFDRTYIGSIQWLSQNCDLKGQDTYLLGDVVNISISDSIDEVHRFVEWKIVSGTAEIADTKARATTVKITGDVVIEPVLKRVRKIEAIAANAGGTISNIGTNEYDEGSNAIFTITPDAGFEIAELYVDEVVTAVSNNSYTFVNVQAAHQIVVVFKPALRILDFDLSYIGSIQWLTQACDLQGRGEYTKGSDAAIAIADSIEGYRFVEWQIVSGEGVIADPKAKSTTVTVNSNLVILPVIEEYSAPAYDAWVTGTSYVGGSIVSHNGQNWKAKWWTLNEEPGKAGVWVIYTE